MACVSQHSSFPSVFFCFGGSGGCGGCLLLLFFFLFVCFDCLFFAGLDVSSPFEISVEKKESFLVCVVER